MSEDHKRRTGKEAVDPPIPDPPSPVLPERVRLTHPHGFVEEDTGRHRHWAAGEVVKDPAEVELLLSRKAPVELVP